jgi:putative ABC transport system substrate-binding protein
VWYSTVGCIVTLTLSLLATPHVADAQEATKVYRIGRLSTGSPSLAADAREEAFQQGLREFGYLEGQNLVLEYRYAEGNAERLPALAVELVRLQVDVLVAGGTAAIHAAQGATRTIPIVMTASFDPVQEGFVASLARPGGNITGLSFLSADLPGKRLELLKETVPQSTRIAVLWHPAGPGYASRQVLLHNLPVAARALGLHLHVVEVRHVDELDPAFTALPSAGADALLVMDDALVLSSGRLGGRLAALAAELVRLKVDVIVASDNPAIAAAQRATSTIPIVMVLAMDPVRTGFVGSLARPGGNTTGLTAQATDIQGKALQLLKDAVPTASRVAVLWDPTEPGREVQATEAAEAARALGLEVHLLGVHSPAELESLFTAMVHERVDAVFVHPGQMSGANGARIAALAAQSRLPTMGPRWLVNAGGLMSYGARDLDLFQRAASYVDKLLRGTKAADLPVEQPMKFALRINLKTAEALGLTIPPSVLFQADEVIR